MDYRGLLLLRAARETGVLDAVVTDAETAADVANETEVTERAARITVDALVDMGFLKDVDGVLEPTNRLLGFMTKTDVRSIGELPHELDSLERWISLPETMKIGEPPAAPPNWTRNELGAHAATDEQVVRASVTAAIHEHPDAERVLDIAGGAGMYAKEFGRRGFDVTLVDDQEVVDVLDPLMEHERVDVVPGDYLEDLPGEFDLVFCADIARTLSGSENRDLLANAHDALTEGGTAVHVDVVREKTADAALIGAEMLTQTENGDTYTETEFGDWFTDAGFEHVRAANVPGTNRHLVAGDRDGESASTAGSEST